MSNSIVWIENDTDVINSVVHPLEKEYIVTRVNTVKEALSSMEHIKKCKLIVLDMILPSGDPDTNIEQPAGLALLRELRTSHGVTQPVIILSVFKKEKILSYEGIDSLDIADILTKPVRPSVLKASVDEALV